jgi:hypothetical protein
MRFKIILSLFVITLLFSCKDSAKDPNAYVIEQRQQQIVKGNDIQESVLGRVFTLDSKLIGTEQSVKDSLNKIVFSKNPSLTNEEKDFVCNCFVRELRKSNDSDSLLSISLHKCSEELRIGRQAKKPNFYFYSKDGEFMGTKTLIKSRIKQEMKVKKVRSIPDEFLDRIVDCMGKKYSKMTSKQIANHEDLFTECMIESF